MVQKSVFLVGALSCICLYDILKKKTTWHRAFLLALVFLLSLVPLAYYLVSNGALKEYYLTNILLHLHLIKHFSPHHTILGMIAQSPPFWLILIAAVFFIMSRKGNRSEQKTVLILALFLFLAASSVRLPHIQFYLLPLSLFCIPASYYFRLFCFRAGWDRSKRLKAVAVFLIVPLVVLSGMMFIGNGEQTARMDYVLKNSRPGDRVYDGDIQFNLFRPDIHYFWYGLKEGKEFDTYRLITGGEPKDFDLCSMIRSQRPKFISSARAPRKLCDLKMLYKPTPFKGVFVLSDD